MAAITSFDGLAVLAPASLGEVEGKSMASEIRWVVESVISLEEKVAARANRELKMLSDLGTESCEI